ncbi:MAG: nitroreductase [Oscillibacter sp.]|nr:nitroreductase [Oscillibacter sp.]
MELRAAIQERHSIRGFLDRPVPRETLEQVLELASRAVSAQNTQPWKLCVARGEPLDAIRAETAGRVREGLPLDMDYPPLEGVYRRRNIDVAKQLFGAMDIAREDRERRDWWTERGFRFFDAPVAIILCMDSSLEEAPYRLDLGCLIQNICLAAMEYGLGTCVEYQGIAYPDVLRKHLGLSEDLRIACGIAVGYPDPDFPANHVVTGREPLENTVTWHGF